MIPTTLLTGTSTCFNSRISFATQILLKKICCYVSERNNTLLQFNIQACSAVTTLVIEYLRPLIQHELSSIDMRLCYPLLFLQHTKGQGTMKHKCTGTPQVKNIMRQIKTAYTQMYLLVIQSDLGCFSRGRLLGRTTSVADTDKQWLGRIAQSLSH
jgi:hypothetical protein